MGGFSFEKTRLEGVTIVSPTVHGDGRGFFMETYSFRDFEKAGFPMKFVQDNHSRSGKDVLRGLHFQKKCPQVKLVRAARGAVFDVVVDLRKNSKSFGQWIGTELSEENKKMLYVPVGFAHGFVTLTEVTEVLYKCTDYYHPEGEGGLIWNDPKVAIDWPCKNPMVSERDQKWPTLEGVGL